MRPWQARKERCELMIMLVYVFGAIGPCLTQTNHINVNGWTVDQDRSMDSIWCKCEWMCNWIVNVSRGKIRNTKQNILLQNIYCYHVSKTPFQYKYRKAEDGTLKYSSIHLLSLFIKQYIIRSANLIDYSIDHAE